MTEPVAKPSVVELLAKVMAEVQAVRKDKQNTQQGYLFRGIDAVVNAVGPALRKHGVVCLPAKTTAHYRDVQTSTGKPSRECTVTVTYRFYGPAMDFIECEVPGESMDFGDKGAPKAMSVAYRIALLQALCIPTDEAEPDASTYERAAPAQREWDGLEQAALVATWNETIGQAADQKALDAIAIRLQAMTKAGELSPASTDHLVQAHAARRAHLNGGQQSEPNRVGPGDPMAGQPEPSSQGGAGQARRPTDRGRSG